MLVYQKLKCQSIQSLYSVLCRSSFSRSSSFESSWVSLWALHTMIWSVFLIIPGKYSQDLKGMNIVQTQHTYSHTQIVFHAFQGLRQLWVRRWWRMIMLVLYSASQWGASTGFLCSVSCFYPCSVCTLSYGPTASGCSSLAMNMTTRTNYYYYYCSIVCTNHF